MIHHTILDSANGDKTERAAISFFILSINRTASKGLAKNRLLHLRDNSILNDALQKTTP